ncbi:MAG: hypothetical protein H8E98_06125 [Bacteroidetes bacterium]|nr:hypothetical protein [Bacteroidota bacterium]
MAEKIKFSEEELSKLKNIQTEFSNVVSALGQIEAQIINTNNQKGFLVEKYNDVQKQQNELAQEFSAKYGTGTLNLETGEFIPQEQTE